MIIAADADTFAALIAGHVPIGVDRLPDSPLADPAVLIMLADLATSIRADFAPAAWVVAEHGCAVGLCSLVKPPADREMTIGYGVAPGCQGGGVATRAVAAIAAWAKRDTRIDAVLADTGIANPASQRVLERNGFVRTGTRHDPEDGDLICWRLDVSSIAP